MLLRLRHCLALLFVANVLLPSSAFAQRANRLATKAFELGDFAEAADGYDKVLRKTPDDAEARYRYAYSLRILGRLTEAEAAMKLLPAGSDPEVDYQYALILTELGRYTDAVEQVYKAARKRHPKADALASRIAYAQAHGKDIAAWKVSNEFANASGDDFAPEAFGDFVVFASSRNGGGTQLYRSVRDENQFLRVPDKVHRVGELAGGEAPVAYAPSGELVAYTRNNFQAGERLIPEAGWELSLVLALPTQDYDFLPGKSFSHNGSGFNNGFPSFSPDGKRLYFSSDRPGGEGGYDLYYSERTSDGWGAPVNLGPEINTFGNEIAPQAASGSLYFSSDYLPGFGGMDIYRADLVNGLVSSVSNLGPAVNSSMDDIGFTLVEGGDIAYFASNRSGGSGGMDLYRAMRSGQAITLAVVDSTSRLPVANAVLDFSECGQGIFLTGADGAYTFRALPSLDCRPIIKKSGYNPKQFSLVATDLKDRARLEILLTAEDKVTSYAGQVTNSRTGAPLEGVNVVARHKSNDFTADAKTDRRGEYTLNLERNGEYAVVYELPGMATIDRELSTSEGDGTNVLSSFAMFPDERGSATELSREMAAGTTAVDVSDPPQPNTPSERTDAQVGASLATPAPVSAPGTPVAVTETTPATVTTSAARPGSVAAGFSVQVAAISSSAADLTPYRSRLSQFGKVYGKADGALTRVRLGPFSTREEATGKLAAVRSAGYGDAFVAAESGGSAVGLPAVETGALSSLQAAGGVYFVRLATYRNLNSFDQAKAAALGDLTTRRKGEFVIVLLQGFTTAEAAQGQLESVRRGGYPDAVVVREAPDGSLENVR